MFCVSGCGLFDVSTGSSPADEPVLCIYDDDHEQLEHLTQSLLQLQESGRATDTTDLIEQLQRGKCSLRIPPPVTGGMNPAAIYRRFKESVVVVSGLYYCENCRRKHASVASGFMISASGAVVTNCHVINDANKEVFAVMTADGSVHTIREVLAADKAADVAIMRIDGSDFKPIALKTDAPVGSPVTVISHPSKHFFMLTQGYVSAYSSDEVRPVNVERMLVTADFGGGSSGGPVIDDNGNATGMVRSTTAVFAKSKSRRGRNYAQMVIKSCVTAKDILALIDNMQ